jgi:hypothetical protein
LFFEITSLFIIAFNKSIENLWDSSEKQVRSKAMKIKSFYPFILFVFSFLSSMWIMALIMHVFYLLLKLTKDGRTLTDPMIFLLNVPVPLGLLIHITIIIILTLKFKNYLPYFLLQFILFVSMSLFAFFLGKYLFLYHLEGRFLLSDQIWWLFGI